MDEAPPPMDIDPVTPPASPALAEPPLRPRKRKSAASPGGATARSASSDPCWDLDQFIRLTVTGGLTKLAPMACVVPSFY